MSGKEATSFAPGISSRITVPFTLSKEALNQKLVLIVDQREVKKKSVKTLVSVKNGSFPLNLPATNEWRTVQSARWN